MVFSHIFLLMDIDSLDMLFTRRTKLQGSQNYTDSSKRRTEWVKESICTAAPSRLLPLAPLGLFLGVSSPLLFQGFIKDQTCTLSGLLPALTKGKFLGGKQDRTLCFNLLALPKESGGRKQEFEGNNTELISLGPQR